MIFVAWDHYLTRARAQKKPWTLKEEYRRLPLACLGGPLYVVGLFWLGWSASPNVHWIVPILSGALFGMGFLLIFMAMLNYLTDAYEVYAASANGIASTCRSVFGALLPLAAGPMYKKLGIAWASSLLGFLSLGMAVVPIVFIRFGPSIREGSKFCNELRELKEKTKGEEEAAAAAGRRQQYPKKIDMKSGEGDRDSGGLSTGQEMLQKEIGISDRTGHQEELVQADEEILSQNLQTRSHDPEVEKDLEKALFNA